MASWRNSWFCVLGRKYTSKIRWKSLLLPNKFSLMYKGLRRKPEKATTSQNWDNWSYNKKWNIYQLILDMHRIHTWVTSESWSEYWFISTRERMQKNHSSIWLLGIFPIYSLCCSVTKLCPTATPWPAAGQASLSFTISQSLLKFLPTELVMPSKHLILCHPLLLLPSVFPSIKVLSNESDLHIRWLKCWSLSISPSSEYSGLISFRIDWFDLLAVQGTLKSFSSTAIRKHQLFSTQPSLWSNSHIRTQFILLKN